ncbi:MAG: TolC family protein, partial [Candidatus Cloacimonetes bacterium]|nr:TolC family protein [Candidatus Cloacimonadota bacterium]
AESDQINTTELIKLDVRQSWQTFNQSLRYLETQEKNLALSERALSIAEARFANQSGIQLEVFDAQIQHNTALISLSQAKIQIIKDYFNLNKSIGYKLNTLIGE